MAGQQLATEAQSRLACHPDKSKTYLYGPALCCKLVCATEELVLHFCVQPVT